MKRYQCIKNCFVLMGGCTTRISTAGKVYRSVPTEMIDTIILVDDFGREVEFDIDYLIQYFRELEPLDELYENPMENWHPLTLMEERKLPAWARIAVAVFISAILLFLISTL